MFLEKTVNKIKGYVKINVYGFFVERFLNLALRENIKLWNIKKDGEGAATAFVSANEYKKIADIAKRTGCKINIEEKVGLPFFIVKHKKRKIFLALFLLIALIIYAYSLRIWNIEIIGDFDFSIVDIKEELELENVKLGVLKNTLNVDEIKNNIYIRRHDIAWIGINFKGTTAVVEVIQANLKKENELDKIPCNIFSTKEGMVYKLNVLEGSSAVKVGDIVKSGDLLVSGIVSSNLADDRYVNAKASIWLKTWYTTRIKIPYERDIISKTGNVERNYTLVIKNYKINLINNDTKYEKYDKIISSNNLVLFGKFALPIELIETTYQEIAKDTVRYTKDQAILKAKNEAKNNVINKLKGMAEIVDTQIKTEEDEDGITVIITVECIEETGRKQKLEGY